MSAEFRFDIKQNTEEWERARLGIPTASEFHRIITPGGKGNDKPKQSSQWTTYMNKLLLEYVTGFPCNYEEDAYQSPWMEHGHDYENKVAQSFELMTGYVLSKVGFVTNWDGTIGASPDRLAAEQTNKLSQQKIIGGVELKSPSPWVQIGYLLDKESLRSKYYCQLQGQLFVCELEKQFIASDSHKLKAEPVILEVPRDDKFQGSLALYLREFVDTMLERRLRLKSEFGLQPPVREVKKALAYDDGGEFGVSLADLDAILGAKE